MSYINSDNIKVYPSGYRGLNGNKAFNPESKYNTEDNVGRTYNALINYNDSDFYKNNGDYVITENYEYPSTSTGNYDFVPFEFVINGYYIKILDSFAAFSDLISGDNIYAVIKVVNKGLEEKSQSDQSGATVDVDNTAINGRALSSLHTSASSNSGISSSTNDDSQTSTNYSNLDIKINDVYQFTGIDFVNNPDAYGDTYHKFKILVKKEINNTTKWVVPTEAILTTSLKNIFGKKYDDVIYSADNKLDLHEAYFDWDGKILFSEDRDPSKVSFTKFGINGIESTKIDSGKTKTVNLENNNGNRLLIKEEIKNNNSEIIERSSLDAHSNKIILSGLNENACFEARINDTNKNNSDISIKGDLHIINKNDSENDGIDIYRDSSYNRLHVSSGLLLPENEIINFDNCIQLRAYKEGAASGTKRRLIIAGYSKYPNNNDADLEVAKLFLRGNDDDFADEKNYLYKTTLGEDIILPKNEGTNKPISLGAKNLSILADSVTSGNRITLNKGTFTNSAGSSVNTLDVNINGSSSSLGYVKSRGVVTNNDGIYFTNANNHLYYDSDESYLIFKSAPNSLGSIKTGTFNIGAGAELAYDDINKYLVVGDPNDPLFSRKGLRVKDLVVDNDIIADGQIQANSFYATSDKRLKENITPINYNKSILDLPVYKYDYINGAKNQIGCMAQDLQELYPELVSENKDGYLTVDNSKVVYLLLEEVKLLKKEIEELKSNK